MIPDTEGGERSNEAEIVGHGRHAGTERPGGREVASGSSMGNGSMTRAARRRGCGKRCAGAGEERAPGSEGGRQGTEELSCRPQGSHLLPGAEPGPQGVVAVLVEPPEPVKRSRGSRAEGHPEDMREPHRCVSGYAAEAAALRYFEWVKEEPG